jgi:hypothetical protein
MPTSLTAAQRTPAADRVNFTVGFATAARFLDALLADGSARDSHYLNLSSMLAIAYAARLCAAIPAWRGDPSGPTIRGLFL